MQSFSNITHILSDIEGTTSSKDFVYKTLFPYSYNKMSGFLFENVDSSFVKEALSALRAKSIDEASLILKSMIDEDKKDPILKSLQGRIWEEGYKDGSLKSHFYEDAVVHLKQWSALGKVIAIYSSGSVLAQKLLFTYSSFGDLSHLVSFYFDTAVGAKREKKSYENIVRHLKLDQRQAKHVLFLSDIEEELVAANDAGLQVCLINRDHSPVKYDFAKATTFSNLKLSC